MSFGNISANLQANPFNAGKLNIISIISIAFISIETLLARIFFSFEAAFFEIMFSLWMFAITGIVIHELLGRSQVSFNYRFYVPRKKLLLLGAFAFFFGVFAQIMAYTLVIGAAERIPFTASSIGANLYLVNLGAAIAEEWAFAWGFLGLWLMLLSSFTSKFKLAGALIANASLFTVYHFAIGSRLHQGELNFLPAMFLFRIALDLSFILSNYDLSVPLIGHFLTNLFKSISANSLAQEMISEGAVFAP